jgi:hypothetical protein
LTEFLELGVPAHWGPIFVMAMLIFLALLLFRPTAVWTALYLRDERVRALVGR